MKSNKSHKEKCFRTKKTEHRSHVQMNLPQENIILILQLHSVRQTTEKWIEWLRVQNKNKYIMVKRQ